MEVEDAKRYGAKSRLHITGEKNGQKETILHFDLRTEKGFEVRGSDYGHYNCVAYELTHGDSLKIFLKELGNILRGLEKIAEAEEMEEDTQEETNEEL